MHSPCMRKKKRIITKLDEEKYFATLNLFNCNLFLQQTLCWRSKIYSPWTTHVISKNRKALVLGYHNNFLALFPLTFEITYKGDPVEFGNVALQNGHYHVITYLNFAVIIIISCCNMLVITHGNIKGKDMLSGSKYCYVK